MFLTKYYHPRKGKEINYLPHTHRVREKYRRIFRVNSVKSFRLRKALDVKKK